MTNISKLVEEFHRLPNDKKSETLKRLNLYITKVKRDIQNEQELNSYTRSIQPRNNSEYTFKIEILLQLRLTDQLLEVLKTTDAISAKKIVKNKRFLTDAFSNMRCEVFFDTIAPFLARSTLMRIINRLPSVLSNKRLACEYFYKLLSKYGIHAARKVLFACDIDCIKNVVEKYKICLTSKEILAVMRENEGFFKFYFKVLQANNTLTYLKSCSPSLLRFIGKRDADFFWEFYFIYKRHDSYSKKPLGEDVFYNLFVNNQTKATDRDICFDMFQSREIFNSLIKRDKLHILLANLCQGGEDEFYEIYLQHEGRVFSQLRFYLRKAPKHRYFYYLNEAYNLKFGKDLVDKPKLFNEDLLKLTPIKYRELVLDRLTLENPDLFYLYSIETAIPILKGRLQQDEENTDSYLRQLFQTCNFHKDEEMLLQILNYIVGKYRHKESVISEIIDGVVRWPNSERLILEVWKAVDEMAKICEYTDDSITSGCFDDYLKNHIINSVTNRIPFDNFFMQMINRPTGRFVNFGTEINSKVFYETVCKLFNYMYKKKRIRDLYVFLDMLIEFNTINRNDKIALIHYGHLLEMYGKQDRYQFIFSVVQNDEDNCLHDLYWKKSLLDKRAVLSEYLRSSPEKFLMYIFLVDAKIVASLTEVDFKNFTVQMKKEISHYCLDILNKPGNQNIDRIFVALKLLALNDKTAFFDTVDTNLILLHGIDDEKHSIKTTISRCFSRMEYNNNPELLYRALNIYDDCKHRKYVGTIKSCANKMRLNEAKVLIKSLSDSPEMHLRKLALILAQDLLDRREFYEILKEMNGKETDTKVKRSVYKKAFLLFQENQDDANWRLLEQTIEPESVNPKYVTEHWARLSKISPRYYEKYALATLKAVIEWTSESEDFWKKELVMHLPKGTQDNLSGDILVDLLKAVPFQTTRSRLIRYTPYVSTVPKDNYHLECVFYTSGEKQHRLFENVLRELEQYVTENWSDFPKAEVFSAVYEFMRAFCKYTFKLKPKYTLVEKFYEKWSRLFLAYPQSKFLMLEFLNVYCECQYVVEEFCKKSNELMKSYVARYGESVCEIFNEQLYNFVHVARIYEFVFFNGFMESNRDRITYVAIAEMLPEECSVGYGDQIKLRSVHDSLIAFSDEAVRLNLSTFSGNQEYSYARYLHKDDYGCR